MRFFPKSDFRQYSLTTLFAATFVCALGSLCISLLPKALPGERDLDNSDRVVLNRLRANGLNINTQHMCGMGELATFDIVRCDDRKFHITQIYLKHRKPLLYVTDIVSLPRLQRLEIAEMDTPKSVTIDDPENLNVLAIQSAIAR